MAVRLLDSAAQALAVTEAELRKLRHDPYELLTRAVQPALWLLIFGQVMAGIRGIPTGQLTYQQFLAPGILAQSCLFVAIFYGIATIWERDLGILAKYLASPAPRSALVVGKAMGAGVRALSQAVVIFALIAVLRIPLRTSPWALLGVMATIILGAAVFSTLSLIIACLVKTRERFMGIGQLITMPLFFASSAIYPVGIMPQWLRTLSLANPLTYQVDALRLLMLPGATSSSGLGLDLAVMSVSALALVLVAAVLYPRILY